MAFLAPSLYLAAQAGLDDGETKCVHRYLLLLCSRYNGTPRSGREGRCICILLVDYLLAYIFCLLHFHSHFSSCNRSAILLIPSILLLSFQCLIYQQRHYIHYHTLLHFEQQQQQQ